MAATKSQRKEGGKKRKFRKEEKMRVLFSFKKGVMRKNGRKEIDKEEYVRMRRRC